MGLGGDKARCFLSFFKASPPSTFCLALQQKYITGRIGVA
jgi:hypothetical protein